MFFFIVHILTQMIKITFSAIKDVRAKDDAHGK